MEKRMSMICVLFLSLQLGFLRAKLISFDRQLHLDSVLKKFQPSVFLLMDGSQPSYREEKILEEISYEKEEILFFRSLKGQCQFFYKLHEFFGTYKLSDPVIIYFGREGKKYLFAAEEFSKKSLQDFIERAQNDAIPLYYQSQKLPESDPGPVFIFNAQRFKEELLNSNKKYVVKFYSPWCPHSQNLEPVFLKLAEQLSKEDLVFVEINIKVNEIAEVPIPGTPSIYFFKGEKSEALRYEGSREQKDLSSWIKEQYEGRPQTNQL